MKHKLFVFFWVVGCLAFSQNKQFVLQWETPKTFNNTYFSITIPYFTPKHQFSFSDHDGISFIAQWEVNNDVDELSLKLSQVNYQTLQKSELKDLNKTRIPEKIEAVLKNVQSRSKKRAILKVSPIINENGVYKKLISFKIQYAYLKTRQFKRHQKTAKTLQESVLKTGEWFKFSVDKSGVYKLDVDFLNRLGINVNTVNPKTIKLYGNGGKMLPYSNSVNYPLDPQENAIKFVGESDGQINAEDYILFYAQGPSGDISNPAINTHINPYTNKTYYYLNISEGNGKRITPFTEALGVVNTQINTFNDYQFHELDEFNIAILGRRWFGDDFSVEDTKTFEFDFPNLVTTTPVKIKTIFVTNSTINTAVEFSVNNESNETITLNKSSFNPAIETVFFKTINLNSDKVALQFAYNNMGNPSAKTYLDYIAIEAERGLIAADKQFVFKNSETGNDNGVGQYTLSNASAISEIWDITNPLNITSINNHNAASSVSFKTALGQVKTFVAVSESDFFEATIESETRVANQNIKGRIFLNEQGVFQDVDYIIITSKLLETQAERLANINRHQYGLNVKVVNLEEIYAEFSSGNPDISAIRNMIKYVYGNALSSQNRLKYVCLFGDSSYDYKNRIENNNNTVPSWFSYNSFSITASYVADDFFVLMDENEGELKFSDRPDIAVGRIVADTPELAKTLVDKIELYHAKEAFGSWRNNFLVISDDVDEEGEDRLQNTSEALANEVKENKPYINVIKVFSDTFKQEASAGGDRYPSVNETVIRGFENGAVVVNYFGHGGEDGLAHERIFNTNDGRNLKNNCKLSSFVTVTCEYTRFDNPNRRTAGEYLFWNKDGGAISLITTTRAVFFSTGIDFNLALQKYLFSYVEDDEYEDGEYPSIAEALRLTKNDPDVTSQREVVFYLGDPALKLVFPKPKIVLTKVNNVPITETIASFKALSKIKLSGEVVNNNGVVLANYNGVLSTTIFDKDIDRVTLANDGTRDSNGEIIKLNYKTLGEVIFRGQASIVNGIFEFDFIVPKDISIPKGYGRVSFYAKTKDFTENQTGVSIETVVVGGINENAEEDIQGPTIQLFMNDENFITGGITNESPTLIAKLEDENGINTASGVGHDIVAVIDGDETNPFILNDFYETEIDNYKAGTVTFPFRDLEPGLHTLTLKAWDVYNNSSISEFQFRVHNEFDELIITNVLNYPNPFVDYTEFWFNHNSSEILDVSVQIFTISGKLVRTIIGQTTNGVKVTSSLSRSVTWDGRDDFGDRIGKGVYIYKLKVHAQASNKTAEKIEKLVIL